MKRKYPLHQNLISYENDFLSGKLHTIFKQQPSVKKFNSTNDDCKDYLYVPQLLKEDTFPDILLNVPLFLLDSTISVGISTSKPIMCNLLHSSLLTANNLFGMDIGRFSHISEVERNNLKICHVIEDCVKTSFNSKTGIFIAIKTDEVLINDKVCKFVNEGNDECQKTDKILLNDYYSVEFELNLETEQNQTKTPTSITLLLYKNQELPKSSQQSTFSILIESEIPLIFDYFEERDEESDNCDDSYDIYSKIIRIVAPELIINSSIQSSFLDFLISSKLTINNKIECKKSIVIRANDLSIQSTIKTDELLIVSSTTTFSKVSSLETSNLCAIFANNSIDCESYKMKLSKNTFFKSRNINFHSKRQASNFEVKTLNQDENKNDDDDDNEEEEEENDESIPNNCFIQGEIVNIGPNFNIKTEENFSIECSYLEISNRKTSIDIGEKLYLLFVTNKTNKKTSINNGVIKCSDLFFEADSEDESPASDFVFQTTNAFTVKRSFLLSSGTFENTGNVLFAAFYVSAYSIFKNTNENSVFKIGDFLVIETDALFLNKGKIVSLLKSTILNSGKMSFLYSKEMKTEKKGRGRKKSDNFLSKSSEEKKKNYSFVCEKFVTNGHIEGDYFSVIANDVISIAGNIKCSEIDLEAEKISVIGLSSICTFKASFKSVYFELSKGLIYASSLLSDHKESNEDDNRNDDNKNDDNRNDDNKNDDNRNDDNKNDDNKNDDNKNDDNRNDDNKNDNKNDDNKNDDNKNDDNKNDNKNDDNRNDDNKNDDSLIKNAKIPDSSIDIFYQKEFVGDDDRIRHFDKIQKIQISNFRDDENRKEKSKSDRKNKKKK